ncbi:MAG TPA: prepilin-type N-terminal cleavage/methylation domain-containing protein [Limnobacter sp.]|nr:prepilin-type N-terminal cleavage/methylation domain-containing protein [Limnobacter sp.]
MCTNDLGSRSHRGFTLLELMIALAVSALLATLALGGYDSFQRRSLRLEANELIQGITTTQLRYRDQNTQYGTEQDLLRFNPALASERFTFSARPITGFEYQQYDATLTLSSSFAHMDTACSRYDIQVRGGVVQSSAKTSSNQDSSRQCLKR